MKRNVRQMLACTFGALCVLSGSANGQDAARPWMEPSPGNRQDTTQQGNMRDSIQGGTLDTTLDRMQDETGRAVDSARQGLGRATDGDSLRDAVTDSVQGSSGGNVEPDNTAINKRDRYEEEPTADDQGQSSTDIEMTRKIRQAIMDDDSLSTYAKNIKIITKDGMVTLKGPVRSLEERTSIEAKAAAIAGTGKITNQIEVKTASSSEND